MRPNASEVYEKRVFMISLLFVAVVYFEALLASSITDVDFQVLVQICVSYVTGVAPI